jgi:hypothetical protein
MAAKVVPITRRKLLVTTKLLFSQRAASPGSSPFSTLTDHSQFIFALYFRVGNGPEAMLISWKDYRGLRGALANSRS